MKPVIPACLAAGALLVAGCGSSGTSASEEKPPPPPATKAQLAAYMDEVCVAIDKAGNGNRTPQQTTKALKSPAVQENLKQLDDVKPQAQYARGFANFRDDVNQIVDTFMNSKATTKDEQMTVIFSLIGPGQRVSKFAKKMGATKCV